MNQLGLVNRQSNEDLKQILMVGGFIVHFLSHPQVSWGESPGRQMEAPGLCMSITASIHLLSSQAPLLTLLFNSRPH